VTYDGALDLSGTSASVHIASGTVVNDAAGVGAGTINDTGDSTILYFDNTQTFNNVTIDLGSTSGGYSFLSEDDLTGAGAVLTLGSNVTIDESGDGEITCTGYSGDGIVVNQGNINQTASGGTLQIVENSFTNSGTITAASSGGALTIEPTNFINSGTLAISDGDAVTIATNLSNTGSITLASGGSLYLGGSFTLAELGKVTNSGGTVYIQGTLDNAGGTLDGSSGLGQVVLDGGTIQGGTVIPSGLGGFSNQRGNTLSGVTYDGTLDVSGRGDSADLAGGTVVNGTLDLGSGASARLASGTVVNNAAGTGAGTINDTGVDSTLYFDRRQTFNNVTINLGSTSRGYSYLFEHDPRQDARAVLTLGSNVTIDESGGAYIETGSYAGDGIVNQGKINQAASGGALYIEGPSFTNSGTITAASSGGALTIDPTTFTNKGAIDISNGETVTIEPTNFTNAAKGVIAVGADSTLYLTPGGSWSNLGSITLASGSSLVLGGSFTFGGSLGSITLASGSSLYLGGSFTLAGSGTVTNSGATVYIDGTLDNTGGTLNGSSVLGQAVLDGGTVQGGTVTPSGLGFSGSGGTLSGVTYDGTLDLSGSGDSVDLASGTVVNNAAGTSAGTINDTGNGSDLYFDTTQTFNNATINLGNTSGYSDVYDGPTTGAVLTLGSGVTIDVSGNGEITDGGAFGDAIVNQGNISQTASDSNLVIESNSFTNSGTITAASSGGSLLLGPNAVGNSGTLAISNGEAVTIELTNNFDTFSNGGVITLASGGSLYLDAENGDSFSLGELGTVSNSGGTIYISGAFFNGGGTLNGSGGVGQLVLSGGTVEGGTATPAGLGFSDWGGTLSGLTYDGTLDLSGASAYVQLASGTVVNNAAGTGAGTINDTGDGSSLIFFDNTQTFNNATINLGSMSGGDSLLSDFGAGTVLTLGPQVTIDESGDGSIDTGGDAADGIVNQGTIDQTGNDSTLTVTGDSFTNSGTITAGSSGGALTIDTTTFTNSGTLAVSNGDTVDVETTVTGTGTETISGASTLEFDSAVSGGTTVGSQNIGFTGGGTLDLVDPTSFYGEISDFAAGDTVELLSSWAFSGFSENSGGTLATLALVKGTTTHAFEFVGDYAQSDFKITTGATSTITHT
jgi:hypothetical protein